MLSADLTKGGDRHMSERMSHASLASKPVEVSELIDAAAAELAKV
jgi:hypothetical protein